MSNETTDDGQANSARHSALDIGIGHTNTAHISKLMNELKMDETSVLIAHRPFNVSLRLILLLLITASIQKLVC